MPPGAPREVAPTPPIAIAIHKTGATGFIIADPAAFAPFDPLLASFVAFAQSLFATLCALLAGLIALRTSFFADLIPAPVAILRLLPPLIPLTGLQIVSLSSLLRAQLFAACAVQF